MRDADFTLNTQNSRKDGSFQDGDDGDFNSKIWLIQLLRNVPHWSLYPDIYEVRSRFVLAAVNGWISDFRFQVPFGKRQCEITKCCISSHWVRFFWVSSGVRENYLSRIHWDRHAYTLFIIKFKVTMVLWSKWSHHALNFFYSLCLNQALAVDIEIIRILKHSLKCVTTWKINSTIVLSLIHLETVQRLTCFERPWDNTHREPLAFLPCVCVCIV